MIVGTNAYRINGTAEHQFLNNNLNLNHFSRLRQ